MTTKLVLKSPQKEAFKLVNKKYNPEQEEYKNISFTPSTVGQHLHNPPYKIDKQVSFSNLMEIIYLNNINI